MAYISPPPCSYKKVFKKFPRKFPKKFFPCYYLPMKRTRVGSTIQQVAYARKLFNGQGKSKKEIALSVGYSPAMANNALAKIENTEGFHNAMQRLATDSNNLLLACMEEYKIRGLSTFSDKDLNGAMNAITAGWDRIAKARAPNKNTDPEQNPLRRVFMQKVENQTINVTPATAPIPEESASAASPVEVQTEEIEEEEVDLDF